jgi:hypothetical protein
MEQAKEMTKEEKIFGEYLEDIEYCYTYEPHEGYCDFLIYKDKSKKELICLCEHKTLGASKQENDATSGHQSFLDTINEKHKDLPFGLSDYPGVGDHIDDYHNDINWFINNRFKLYDNFISGIEEYFNKNKNKIKSDISCILPKDYDPDNRQLVEIFDLKSNELKAVSVVSNSGNYHPIYPPYKLLFSDGKEKVCKKLESPQLPPTIHLRLFLGGRKGLISPVVISPSFKPPRIVRDIEKAYKQLKNTAKEESININSIPSVVVIYSDIPFICADEVDKYDLQTVAYGNTDGECKFTGRFGIKTGKSPIFNNQRKNSQLWAIALFDKFDKSLKIIPNSYKKEAKEALCKIFTSPNDEISVLNKDRTADWKNTNDECFKV